MAKKPFSMKYNIPRTCEGTVVSGWGTRTNPFVPHKCRYKAMITEPATMASFSWYEGAIVEVVNPGAGLSYCKRHSPSILAEKEAQLTLARYKALKEKSIANG